MKKKEYLEELDQYNFDKNEYCIIAGGTMLMYGLKSETGDIDLRISLKLFNELKFKYNLIATGKFPNHYEFNDIEVRVVDLSLEDIVYIDNYPVSSILKEKEWKLKSNREKDKKDLELIERYLNKKGDDFDKYLPVQTRDTAKHR